jgi:hypothetical protein
MRITKIYSGLLLAATGLSLTMCNSADESAQLSSQHGIFDFKALPDVPTDISADATDTALAAYAWQEFLALNWKSTYDKDGHKGEPDLTWTYASDTLTQTATVVWETYAHRSELSPYVYPMRPFDSACKYSYRYAPQPGANSPSFGLLHNLDETSEIGSCNLNAFADSQNLYTDTFRVRYQAKVNRTEYDYIRNTFPTQDSLSNTVARTQQYVKARYNDSTYTPSAPLLTLPDGSIEVKTAWRPLGKNDDPSKFLTRTVIDYSSRPVGNTFTYTNKTYGLIGIHIIHKSKNHPSFVFATWEHIGVMEDRMRYILLTENAEYDTLGYRVPLRAHPIPIISMISTDYVHQNLLPSKSIWQNYRLVGVQGTPNNSEATPNFFLSNYVIESDSLLAFFHGSGFANPFDGKPNVLYNNNLYSVGGCQGCHGGGAQHTGTDFSFIVNSPNLAPDAVAGKPVGGVTKLQLLKKRLK